MTLERKLELLHFESHHYCSTSRVRSDVGMFQLGMSECHVDAGLFRAQFCAITFSGTCHVTPPTEFYKRIVHQVSAISLHSLMSAL